MTAAGQPAESTTFHASSDPSSGSLARARVLVVDDDAPCGRTLAGLLGDSYSVTLARDGVEALHIIETPGAFDVIVCDVETRRGEIGR